MFTDIIKQFDHIIEAVKQTDVKQKPFKHLYITEVLGVHEYRTITEFATHDDLTCTDCLLYTSPSPRDRTRSRMPSSA